MTINTFLALICIVNARRWILFEPGPVRSSLVKFEPKPVRGSTVNDINKVVRSQMGMIVSEYNDQKIARGNIYDSLKNGNFLKALKTDLKKDFRKTVKSTGRDSPTEINGQKSRDRHK